MSPRAGLTTARVVDAAAALADKEGLAAVSLARVASTLGVRTPSLYSHVGGLDDLHRELRLRGLRDLGDRLRDAAVGRATDDAVRALAHAYRDWAREHPGLYETTAVAPLGDDAEIRRVGDTVVATVMGVLSGYGFAAPAEALHATRTFRSLLHGFVSLELAGGFALPVALDDTFAWLVDLLCLALSDPGRVTSR